MSVLTPEQYMALSAAANTDFTSIDKDKSLDYLLDNSRVKDQDHIECSALYDLGGWTLISFQPTTASGFAAAAFQAPDNSDGTPGEIVFSFRGTEPGSVLDYKADIQIVLPGATHSEPNQFIDAYKFFQDTIEAHQDNTGFSFTGHSLGGGIAQYMTYATHQVGHSTTFNAVGIGQALTRAGVNVNPDDYNDSITDYVNENDLIGEIGTQLGSTKYKQDANPARMLSVDIGSMAQFWAIEMAVKMGLVSPDQGVVLLNIVRLKLNSPTAMAIDLAMHSPSHSLDQMLTKNETSGKYELTANASGSTMQLAASVLGGGSIDLNPIDNLGQLAANVVRSGIGNDQRVVLDIYDMANASSAAAAQLANQVPAILENAGQEFSSMVSAWLGSIFGDTYYLSGTQGSDSISGVYDKKNVLYGLAGNDTIRTDNYTTNTIFGGGGDDIIYGGNASDTINGGADSDTLYGGAGNDKYTFNRGDGQDTITDYDRSGIFLGNGFDTISFLNGITPNDILVQRMGTSIGFDVIGTSDSIIAHEYFDYFGSGKGTIEQVDFADGTVWDEATIRDKARYIYGTDGAETITGYETDDIITGGAGNDILRGDVGSDKYVFAPDFGIDTIYDYRGSQNIDSNDVLSFLEGINPADVIIKRSSYKDLDVLVGNITNKITIQEYFSSYFKDSNVFMGVDSNAIEEFRFADGTVWDLATIKERARYVNGTILDDTLNGYEDQQSIISGLDGDDTITAKGTLGDNVYGGNGNDMLIGGRGNDRLYGDNGNDTIDGGSGNDQLEGGTGDDRLEGKDGDDTYVFTAGFGVDTIYDNDDYTGYGMFNPDSHDSVTFLAGIEPANIILKRINYSDLELTFTNLTDKLTIKNYFNRDIGSGVYINAIEEFRFADDTVWDINTIKDKASIRNGTDSGEMIYGFDDMKNVIYGLGGDDMLIGGRYDDKLYGGDGNDMIGGGGGNDRLEGGAGNDTYVYGINSGNCTIYDLDRSSASNVDTVNFMYGISPTNVSVKRNGANLELSITETSSKLIVERYFATYNNYASQIEQIRFSDGTMWGVATIQDKVHNITGTAGSETLSGYSDQANTISGLDGNDYLYGANLQNDALYGGNGNDMLYGYSGNDILDGGAGGDRLEGSTGNDTYVFGQGYGADTIYDYDTTAGNHDTVLFGDNQQNLIFSHVGNNLKVSVAGTANYLTVSSWYSGSAYQTEEFKSSTGSTLANTQVDQLIQAMASFSSTNGGMSWSDALQQRPQDVQNITSQYWTVPTA